MATALQRSSVTRSWCCFVTTGVIAAVFRTQKNEHLLGKPLADGNETPQIGNKVEATN
jgi:hypothetical protein